MNDRVLFLCSGNYYRSRFAELVFNHLAAARGLHWRAESRGFRLNASNVGPISPHARDALLAAGIPLETTLRFPLAATEQELLAARLVVALDEAEHRPMMCIWFPQWIDRVEYWNIRDVHWTDPSEALPALRAGVERLIERLENQRPVTGGS
jgi:protein-tyrosine phosphatase